MSTPAHITIRRRVEWMDTDASGIYHWTTACRLAEAAEVALHAALGIAERTFGRTPRMHVSYDFHKPLRFNDVVDVHLEVVKVGHTSLTQRVRIEHGQRVAATGEVVMCYIDGDEVRPVPWPDDLRAMFKGAGRQGEDQGLPAAT